MNIPNIYQGLEVEPPQVAMIEQIHLMARVVDNTHFVFIPEKWEAALKPYKAGKWSHEKGVKETGWKTWGYELKRGNYLTFPQFFNILDGGFYVSRLYSIVKSMEWGGQAHGTFTKDELMIEIKDQGYCQRVVLKNKSYGWR